jgi:hypothetical protein
MKLLTTLFLFLSLNAWAAKPQEMNLVSYMNFGLAAAEVIHLDSGKVRILVKSAILNYGDRNNWDQTRDQVNKLKEMFEMEKVDGLSFTFDEQGCGVNKEDNRIFSCYLVRDTEIVVHAITHDMMGIPGKHELSEKSIIAHNARVSLSEVIRRSVRGEEQYLEASMSLNIKEGDEFFNIYRTKTHLTSGQSW